VNTTGNGLSLYRATTKDKPENKRMLLRNGAFNQILNRQPHHMVQGKTNIINPVISET
jgi:hypothetical protein